jgi:hypothetical protein
MQQVRVSFMTKLVCFRDRRDCGILPSRPVPSRRGTGRDIYFKILRGTGRDGMNMIKTRDGTG